MNNNWHQTSQSQNPKGCQMASKKMEEQEDATAARRAEDSRHKKKIWDVSTIRHDLLELHGFGADYKEKCHNAESPAPFPGFFFKQCVDKDRDMERKKEMERGFDIDRDFDCAISFKYNTAIPAELKTLVPELSKLGLNEHLLAYENAKINWSSSQVPTKLQHETEKFVRNFDKEVDPTMKMRLLNVFVSRINFVVEKYGNRQHVQDAIRAAENAVTEKGTLLMNMNKQGASHK